ncbi:hypothetical protein SCALM49S_00842 [Streptomyces californicus]
MPRRDPLHAGVGRAVAERFGGLGAGEQGGEVPDVELGLDEVGERQGRGGEGGAAGPRGVEDGPGAGQVARDGDAAADLHDGGVAPGPGREVAHRAAARGEQADAQLLVGGAAAAEDREARGGRALGGRDADDADLVGPPVTDRPERIRVAPQQLGAHGVDRAPLSAVAARRCRLAAILLHPTNQRIAASTGCGQTAHRMSENTAAGHAATTMPQERVYGQRTPEEHAPLAKARRVLHRGHNNGTPRSGSSRGAVPRPPWRPFRARSGRWASPPGPFRRSRGMERRVSPSPLSPVQWADPRRTQPTGRAGAGPERTAGRTATHRGHAPHRRTDAAATAPASRADNNPAIRTSTP